jgi:hypothetical protein
LGRTVIGVFRHSGDADLAAAYLREEFTLGEDHLEVIDDSQGLETPAHSVADTGLLFSTLGDSDQTGEKEPIGKRWGDRVAAGDLLVVVRSDDADQVNAIAYGMRVSGAERVDLLP